VYGAEDGTRTRDLLITAARLIACVSNRSKTAGADETNFEIAIASGVAEAGEWSLFLRN
jgi:hypothetical protein